MRSWRAWVFTANFGRGETSQGFVDNLTRVLDVGTSTSLPVVVGAQEFDEADAPDEHSLARPMLEREGWAMANFGLAVPILTKRLWLNRSWSRVVARGLPKITPRRPLSQAVYGTEPGLPDLAVLNVHFPLFRPPTPRRKVGTISRRRAVRRAIKAAVRVHLAEGRFVVLTTDSNTHWRMRTLVPGQHRAVDRGIDKVYAWAPKGWRVWTVRRHTVDMTIDSHNAQGALIEWSMI